MPTYAATIERRRGHTGLRGALIDMDGTLYDSMPRHAQSWQTLARELGFELDPMEIYLNEGRTGADTIAYFMRREFGREITPEEAAGIYRRKTELFRQLPPVDPMPGAARMLRVLADNGIARVLVTGSGQSSLISRLDTDYPGHFPTGMRITAADVTHGKPHPEPFLRAMERAGATPAECIVVENAPMGVEAGAASGALTVGVCTGPIPASVLRDAGADITFGSMQEFADALPQIIRIYNSPA